MGYFARRWFYNCWCVVCIFVFIGISTAFSFNPFGMVIAGIVAGSLFFIEVIILLIKRAATKGGGRIKEPTQRTCPRCLVKVDSETGVCPVCGGQV